MLSGSVTRDSCTGPLSFGQERLWLLDQLLPGHRLQNVATAYRLTGALDVAALRQALRGIAERHDVLRTTFQRRDGQVVQVVGAASDPVTEHDLRALPGDIRESTTRAALAEEVGQGFDLQRGPLWRVRLLRVDRNDWLLVVTMHHLVTDGWSAGLFLRELRAFYDAAVRGDAVSLPPLPIQYREFARAQRERLQQGAFAREVAYWTKQLKGVPSVLQLPMDRPRPRAQTFASARYPWTLPAQVTARLHELSRRAGVTLFMTLLAGFNVVLARYVDQDEMVVGAPIAGRTRAELEPLLGFFANMLVLRTDLAGDPSVETLLRRVRAVCLAAYEHQDLPFEQVIEALHPDREVGRPPLVQVVLQMQNTPADPPHLAGLQVRAHPLDPEASAVDLRVFVGERDGALRGFADYSTEVFEEATIGRLLEQYAHVLEQMALDPKRPISKLPLEIPREPAWRATPVSRAAPVASTLRVDQWFEATAAAAPEEIAIRDETTELTYRMLQDRADEIARALEAADVRPTDPVAVLLPSGGHHAAAVLGVLKAGASFLCLDPAMHADRIVDVLVDAGPTVVLTERALLDRVQPLAADGRLRLILVDDDVSRGPREARRSLRPDRITAEAPAYIAYTSGSTGRPKGIVQSHASFVRFLHWFQHTFTIRSGVRIAQWCSVSFDPAYVEIVGALCAGATLCVPPPGLRQDPRAFADWIRRERIGILQVVPSFLRELYSAWTGLGATAIPSTLRCIIVAGEALPVTLAAAWRERFPTLRLVNLYGPAEVVVATMHEVDDASTRRRSIPVGRPIGGCEIAIVDPEGRPCPVGVPGEIHVASRYLTDGYWRSPSATAAAFAPHPTRAAARAYRTGDIGRWLTDGTIEFLGRRDQQLKIRGMRVEMGAVEEMLLEHPDVDDAAVVADRDDSGDARLLGYIRIHGKVTPAEVRAWLRTRLPEFMVPARVFALAALPRTPSGKIDRPALRALAVAPDAPVGDEPRTRLEQLIAHVWREVLQVPRVTIHDNFFDLGGHSLSATRVVNHLRDLCRIELPLQTFFSAPTIAALATHIESNSPAVGQVVASLVEVIAAAKRSPEMSHAAWPDASL